VYLNDFLKKAGYFRRTRSAAARIFSNISKKRGGLDLLLPSYSNVGRFIDSQMNEIDNLFATSFNPRPVFRSKQIIHPTRKPFK